MERKSRIAWFSFFYIVLLSFAIYNLVFLVIIWNNHELFNLYIKGFIVIGEKKEMLNYSSSFGIYGLITIGTIFNFFGILGIILSQSLVSIASTPRKKLVGLIVGFLVVMIGFYFGFIAQLFYSEWNTSSIKIQQPGQDPISANYFYKNWIHIIVIWLLFIFFLLLLILCIFLILRLHQANISLSKYNREENKEELNLEITAPFPSNVEFDPNETQTITLNLDTTDKIMPWKKKKKNRIKQKKNKKN
ncbi:MAG: hypothetical protein REH79_01670 [Spiroplasma sp.]|nr:hypothetical protein [Spiroplasma sp.]